jgi:dTDP-glucose pyrophosphorylase
MKEVALVYIVAGISSRFGGKIKQFAQIGKNGESLIELSLKQALHSSFSKIIFVVGNLTEKPFKDKFGSSFQGIPIYYANQFYDPNLRDRPWGTGDALCAAKEFLSCPFVICNGDDIYGDNTFAALFNHLQNSDQEATIGYPILDVLPKEGTVNRGIFEAKDNYVTKITETFSISQENLASKGLSSKDLCSQNVFAFHPQVLDLLNNNLTKFKLQNSGDRKIEFLLPNEISNFIQQEKIKVKLYPSSDIWLGITNPGDESIVKEEFERIYGEI